MQVLEQAGASMVNGIQTMQLCQNKMASALTLNHGIPTPKTAFVSNEDSIGIALKKTVDSFRGREDITDQRASALFTWWTRAISESVLRLWKSCEVISS